MHANIAALGSAVPVVALSYSHKTPGIMALFGQDDCVIDGRAVTAQRLIQTLHAVWASREARRTAIGAALKAVREDARDNVRIIETLTTKSRRSSRALEPTR